MAVKMCSKCLVERPTTEFYKLTRAPDGLRPDCKRCSKYDNKDRADAYQKASAELRRRHPDEFAGLYETERNR